MGVVLEIQRFCVHDGPGIRTTVFLKGCPLRCKWCHNPEGYTQALQLAFVSDKCIGCGACAVVCPNQAHGFSSVHELERSRCMACGRCTLVCPTQAVSLIGLEMQPEDVISEALRDSPFYGREGGVTFSGGECTAQPGFLLALLAQAKACGLNTAVDTCGEAPWSVFETIAPLTDWFLYDIKLIDPVKHKLYTGANNARILDNYARLIQAGARVEVRIPVIPGVNDNAAELARILWFLKEHGAPQGIVLLPFHRPGHGKYKQLGLTEWVPEDESSLDLNTWQAKANKLCTGG